MHKCIDNFNTSYDIKRKKKLLKEKLIVKQFIYVLYKSCNANGCVYNDFSFYCAYQLRINFNTTSVKRMSVNVCRYIYIDHTVSK